MNQKFAISKHAREQMAARGIGEDLVWKTVEKTKPVVHQDGLTVYHSSYLERGKEYLIRIFVNESIQPNLIVTVYKTSKISKYL